MLRTTVDLNSGMSRKQLNESDGGRATVRSLPPAEGGNALCRRSVGQKIANPFVIV